MILNELQPKAIVNRMKLIASETGVEYDEEALQVIARAAEGGMRDALSLLDQAISFGNEKVTPWMHSQ